MFLFSGLPGTTQLLEGYPSYTWNICAVPTSLILVGWQCDTVQVGPIIAITSDDWGRGGNSMALTLSLTHTRHILLIPEVSHDP